MLLNNRDFWSWFLGSLFTPGGSNQKAANGIIHAIDDVIYPYVSEEQATTQRPTTRWVYLNNSATRAGLIFDYKGRWILFSPIFVFIRTDKTNFSLVKKQLWAILENMLSISTENYWWKQEYLI